MFHAVNNNITNDPWTQQRHAVPKPSHRRMDTFTAGLNTRIRLGGLAYDALALLHQLGVFLMVLAVQVGLVTIIQCALLTRLDGWCAVEGA
jgi:hypothetical protein